MPITFFIPTELDISGALTVGGNLISATGGRLQAGSGSNSTLMATDSGAFANLVALLAASGALAAQTAASGQALYNFATGISGALENIIINDTTLTVSGSSSLSTINFIGVGGMLVTLSGTGTLVFSGGGGAGGSFDPLGTAALTGQALYNDIIGLSGYVGSVSGGLQAQIAGGNGTQLKVTGSNVLSSATISGTGGLVAFLSGTTIFLGPAGAGGSYDPLGTAANTGLALYTQLTGASGALLNLPQTNLAGSTGLNINTCYYDNFGPNRVINFFGTPLNGSFITLRANVTGQCSLQFPQSNRIGQQGMVTGLNLNLGNQEISWIYVNTNWWLADSTSLVNNLNAARVPAVTDDVTSGYFPGSLWLNTGTSQPYMNINSTSGGAVWFAFGTGNAVGSFDPLGTAANTGQILYLDITGMSGQLSTNVANIYATITNLTQTGVTIEAQLTSLSGFTTGLSGHLATNIAGTYATIVSLTQTGITIEAQLTSLSGFTTGVSGSLASQIIVPIKPPLGFTTDGAGNVVSSGVKGYIVCPYAGTINSWSLIGSQVGTIGLDIWKIASGSTLPTTSIVGAANLGPILNNAAIAYSNNNINNWTTTTVSPNDIFGWVITGSPIGVTRITFQLNIV